MNYAIFTDLNISSKSDLKNKRLCYFVIIFNFAWTLCKINKIFYYENSTFDPFFRQHYALCKHQLNLPMQKRQKLHRNSVDSNIRILILVWYKEHLRLILPSCTGNAMHHKSDFLVYELTDLQAYLDRRSKWSRENCFQFTLEDHKEFCEDLLVDSKHLISVPNVITVSSDVDHHFLLLEIWVLFDMPWICEVSHTGSEPGHRSAVSEVRWLSCQVSA